MTEQPNLFNWTPPLMIEPRAHHGVETSEAAARRIAKCSGPMQLRIARYLNSRADGAHYDEIVVALSMEKPTVAGRLNDLSSAGFIEAFAKRPTRSGNAAKVYRLTALGKKLIEKGTAE